MLPTKYLKMTSFIMISGSLAACTFPVQPAPQIVVPEVEQPAPVVQPVASKAIAAPIAVITPAPAPAVEPVLTQEEIDRARRAEARERRIEERKQEQNAATNTPERAPSERNNDDDDDDDDRDRGQGWTPV